MISTWNHVNLKVENWNLPCPVTFIMYWMKNSCSYTSGQEGLQWMCVPHFVFRWGWLMTKVHENSFVKRRFILRITAIYISDSDFDLCLLLRSSQHKLNPANVERSILIFWRCVADYLGFSICLWRITSSCKNESNLLNYSEFFLCIKIQTIQWL